MPQRLLDAQVLASVRTLRGVCGVIVSEIYERRLAVYVSVSLHMIYHYVKCSGRNCAPFYAALKSVGFQFSQNITELSNRGRFSWLGFDLKVST